MADRRPPMPRNGGAASSGVPRPPRAVEPEAEPKATRPGASKHTPAPRTPRAPRPAQAPAQTPAPKVVPLGAVPEEDTRRPAAGSGHPAPPRAAPRNATRKPATPKPAAPKPRPTASQRRSDDRTMLSGAIRAPRGSAPAGPKPPGKANTEESKPVPARSFSGRLLVLSLVLAVFAVMLVPTIGIYTRQRVEINDLRASIAEKQVEQQDLKDQIARWDDPLFIKQQARDRINLVMPGERNYMVIGSTATSPEAEPANESPEQVRTDLPWVDALWDTVQRAATD